MSKPVYTESGKNPNRRRTKACRLTKQRMQPGKVICIPSVECRNKPPFWQNDALAAIFPMLSTWFFLPFLYWLFESANCLTAGLIKVIIASFYLYSGMCTFFHVNKKCLIFFLIDESCMLINVVFIPDCKCNIEEFPA